MLPSAPRWNTIWSRLPWLITSSKADVQACPSRVASAGDNSGRPTPTAIRRAHRLDRERHLPLSSVVAQGPGAQTHRCAGVGVDEVEGGPGVVRLDGGGHRRGC